MSKPPLTPGETALADELAAYCRDEVAELALAVRMGDAENGEAQNLANFTAYLRERSSAELAALLVIAVRRASAGDTPGCG